MQMTFFVLLLAAASCNAVSSHRSFLNHQKTIPDTVLDVSRIHPGDEGDTFADSTLYRDDVINLNPSNVKTKVSRTEPGHDGDSKIRLAKHQDPIIVSHRGTAKGHSVSYREPTIQIVSHTTVAPVGGHNSPVVPVVSTTSVAPTTVKGHVPAVPVVTPSPAVYAVSHIPSIPLVTPAPATSVLGHVRPIPGVGHSNALHALSPFAAPTLSGIPPPTAELLSTALFVKQVPSVTGFVDNHSLTSASNDAPKNLGSHLVSSSSYGELPKISTKSHNSEYSISTSYGAPPPPSYLHDLAPKVSVATNVINQVSQHIPQDDDGILAYLGSQPIPLVLSTPRITNTHQYSPLAPLDPVKSQYHAQDELGQYTFGYLTGDATREETRNAYGHVRGSFSYVDSNGLLQSQYYVADDNGFRVAGTNLPVS